MGRLTNSCGRSWYWPWVLLMVGWVAGCRGERPPAYFSPSSVQVERRKSVVLAKPAGGQRLVAMEVPFVPLHPHRRKTRLPHVSKILISKHLFAQYMPPSSTPAPRAHAQPTAQEKTPATVKAGSLIILSGVLVAVGGILLGIALGGAWVVLTGGLGLAAGIVLGMLGLFGALSTDSRTQIRFTGTLLLGLLVALGGVALGVSLGGLLGVGAGLLLLGIGSFLTGWSLVSDLPAAQPRPAQPVTK